MRQIFVVSEQDVEGRQEEGDTALEKVDHGPRHRLEGARAASHPLRPRPLAAAWRTRTRDELLYAVSGSGTLELDGEPHDLQPESGAYVRAGETYVIDNPGPDELLIVSTSVPVEQVYRSPREVIVRFADRPELRADAKRTFRYLVNQDAGLHGRDAVRRHRRALPRARSQPLLRRGGLHRRGRGIRAHRRRIDTPPPGSCFHLPPEQVHCIENTGPGVMRILGVFHPSGDPASRAYEDDSQLIPASVVR